MLKLVSKAKYQLTSRGFITSCKKDAYVENEIEECVPLPFDSVLKDCDKVIA